MHQDYVIKITNLSKKYTLGKQRETSFRSAISGIFKSSKSNRDEFWALKDVSFDVHKGDVIGIIGKNGAGKSTLLKVLSQITKPTEGRIEINGRIASLLEVGTGFHPELTGRENIYLNGTILGMTRAEVKAKFNEIVAFSEIEKFIDTPVKHYSSGMYVRLAFAVAAHLEPEILIIDEVLAVGDAEFQKKCLGKMRDVANDGRTVLFVSHHLGSVKQLCNKGILLEKGKIVCTGFINEVISTYQTRDSNVKIYSSPGIHKQIFVHEAMVIGNLNEFYYNEVIQFQITIKSNEGLGKNKFLLIRIVDENEQVVGSSEIIINRADNIYTYQLDGNVLVKGKYKLNCIIYQPGVIQFDNVDECCHFEILDNNPLFAHLETFDIGKVYIPNKWI
jgi:lipopolysaccharide transport system ATP-binding protein